MGVKKELLVRSRKAKPLSLTSSPVNLMFCVVVVAEGFHLCWRHFNQCRPLKPMGGTPQETEVSSELEVANVSTVEEEEDDTGRMQDTEPIMVW
ncbi:hypothetical protein D4764_17G0000030 [Takifugu flavidus]|uniref:Uncharacterized protein n=1 Tax=Takifugu flavidus TaxID=433684 RepID=A0A5C6NVC5_9TELE|nr:hypothetical protein D4764_17G0000030 [Takifugu flavidus]